MDESEERNYIMMRELLETNDVIRQQLNEVDTKIFIEATKRETELRGIHKRLEAQNTEEKRQTIDKPTMEMLLSSFNGNESDIHPKQFLRELDTYIERKKASK